MLGGPVILLGLTGTLVCPRLVFRYILITFPIS